MAGPSLLSCGGAHLVPIDCFVRSHVSRRIIRTAPPPVSNLQPIPRTLPALHQAPQQPGGASLRTCLRSDQGRYFLPRTVPANVSTPRPIHHLKNGDTPAINATSRTRTTQASDDTKERTTRSRGKRPSSVAYTAAAISCGPIASGYTSNRTAVRR